MAIMEKWTLAHKSEKVDNSDRSINPYDVYVDNSDRSINPYDVYVVCSKSEVNLTLGFKRSHVNVRWTPDCNTYSNTSKVTVT